MPNQSRIVKKSGEGGFGPTLRKRIDAALAIDVIHNALKGKETTRIQLDAAKVALNKCLPDLQAVTMDVTDKRMSSLHDVNARLLLNGLQPDQVWKLLGAPEVIEHVKTSTESSTSDDPPTPESASE